MQQHAVFTGDGTNVGERSNGADFAVDVHDGDENGMPGNGFADSVRIDQPGTVNRHIGHFKALLFERLAGVKDGFVLGRRGNEMVSLVAVCPGNAFERQVVGFGSPAGKDNFFRCGIDQRCYLLACRLHRFLGFPAIAVRATGGIAEFVGEVGHHGVEHRRSERRGGVMIEVNRSLHTAHPFRGTIVAPLARQ